MILSMMLKMKMFEIEALLLWSSHGACPTTLVTETQLRNWWCKCYPRPLSLAIHPLPLLITQITCHHHHRTLTVDTFDTYLYLGHTLICFEATTNYGLNVINHNHFCQVDWFWLYPFLIQSFNGQKPQKLIELIKKWFSSSLKIKIQFHIENICRREWNLYCFVDSLNPEQICRFASWYYYSCKLWVRCPDLETKWCHIIFK